MWRREGEAVAVQIGFAWGMLKLSLSAILLPLLLATAVLSHADPAPGKVRFLRPRAQYAQTHGGTCAY